MSKTNFTFLNLEMKSPDRELKIEISGVKTTQSDFETIMKIGRKNDETIANIIDETNGTNRRGTKTMFTRGILIKDASFDLGAIRVTLCPKFSNCLRISRREFAWRKMSTASGLTQRVEIFLKLITPLNVLFKIYDFNCLCHYRNTPWQGFRILSEIGHSRSSIVFPRCLSIFSFNLSLFNKFRVSSAIALRILWKSYKTLSTQ